jgi:lysozyme family protein
VSAGFDRAFAVVVGAEGGYDSNPDDPGNWTGGRVGAGELRGTKYGVSAAAFPSLSIATLTLDQARTIYESRYWQPIHASEVPEPLALLLFDAAVNNGPSRAVGWLQGCVGAVADGVVGPLTLAAISRAIATHGLAALCGQYLAERLTFMAALPTWRLFGHGWSRRLCTLAYDSMSFTQTEGSP